MKNNQRLPKGFKVSVNEQGLGRFSVTVNHLGRRVAYFWRNFPSSIHARQTGVASAIALSEFVQRGIKL